MTITETLLAAHDTQIRATVEARLPRTWTAFPDGRVLRVSTPHRSFVFSDGLADASEDELDGYIHRARDFFAERNEPVEWKLYSNDHPLLRSRLEAAGFRAEHEESVIVGRVADVLDAGQAPEGVTIRATSTRATWNGSPPWSRRYGDRTGPGWRTTLPTASPVARTTS